MNKIYKYSNEEMSEVIRLSMSGLTPTQIHDKLNIPRSSVSSIINRRSEKYKCSICNMPLSSPSNLKRHNAVHGIVENSNIPKENSTAFTVYVFLNGNRVSLSEVTTKLANEAKLVLSEIEALSTDLRFFEKFDQVLLRFSELQCSVSNLKEAKLQLEKKLFRASEVVHSQD